MKVRMIVSRDGTMILADDCVVFETEMEVSDFMHEQLGDSERYDFAKEYGATNV